MDIRLLGPFEVLVEGREATPASRAERELLAFLALRPGRVVPAEQVIDALWGERLPANPANALQLRVSKLRKAVASAGGDPAVIATRAPGYLLDLDARAVDASRAAAAIAEGRSLAAAGDTVGALERLRAAEAEWRGAALTGFVDLPWSDVDADRLDTLRVAAAEERLHLELQAGRHAEVLDELEALVRDHPLRERLHGLRMLALYRAGQQAAALEAYQHARRTLEDELGLDPSPQLRQLEAAILRHDPVVAGSPAGAARPASELPAARTTLVGRDAELDELTALLTDQRLVTITGPGGAGKTTLAAEVARRTVADHPDGAWFVELANIAGAGDLAGVVTDTLDLPPAEAGPPETANDRIARHLASRRALLVLDNCEHVVDAAAALVDRLLARCPDLTVVATSREALATAGEVQYALGPLAVPDQHADAAATAAAPAVQLFVERAAAVARGFDPDEDELRRIAGICRDLDGMPLAIELAAARTRTLSTEQVAARLEDRFALLTSSTRTAERRHQTLRATIDWSHQLLDEPERRLLRRLSVLTGAFDLTTVEQVCTDDQLPTGEVVDVVERLVDRSLVVRDRDGRFRLLETVRAFAAEQLEEAGELEQVQARDLERLQALADEAVPALRGPDQQRWLRTLDAQQDGLRAALAFCADRADRFGSLGLRLAARLGWWWYLGDHEEGRRQLQRLLQVTDADADPVGHALALEALSMVERPSACVVHPSEPCADAARRAAELFARVGDDHGRARAQLLLAVEGIRGAGVDDALRLVDDAATVFERCGDRWQLALVAFVRMEVLLRVADPDDAIRHGRDAARRFEDLGDRWGISAVHGHLSHNLTELGRIDEAVASSSQAMAMAREVGLANTVQLLGGEAGMQRLMAGDEAGAEEEFLGARAVARRYGYRAGDGLGAAGLGFLARRHGDLDRAARWFEHAAPVLTETGSMWYVAIVLAALGYVRGAQGRTAEAAACHRRVADLATSWSDPYLLAAAREGLARVALDDGDAARAAELLEQASTLRRERRRPVFGLFADDVAATTEAVGVALHGQSATTVTSR